jgi:hypothetical protein
VIADWEAVTKRAAPALVQAFAVDADAALDALLEGAAGPVLAQRGPAGVLARWLSPFRAESLFAQAVDGAVARRIAAEWQPNGGTEARRRALRLSRLFDIVSSTPGRLPQSATELQRRFDTRDEALRPWSPSPSQDPLGRFLLAVARTQENRSLAPFWYSYCRLPPSVPLFRAEYGIHGLRGLPREEESVDDEFPHEVAAGLRMLADGLRVAIESDRTDLQTARRTLLSIAQVCIAAYPLGGWAEHILANVDASRPVTIKLLEAIAALDQRAATTETLRRMFSTAAERARTRERSSQEGAREAPRASANQQMVGPLLAALREGRPGTPDRMQRAIDSARRRAEIIGDPASEFGSLLARASSAARVSFPQHAVRWSEEALLWEPWDVRAWTIATAAYRAAGRAAEGMDTAWRAHARFPFEPYVWTEVGTGLVDAGRHGAAEVLLLHGMERFPDDPSLISAFGELLIDTGRPAEAVDILRQATERFEAVAETAPNLWAGLTAALISTGAVDDARMVRERARALLPTDRWASQTNFERFRRERERRDARFKQAVPEPPSPDGALFSVISEARILRQGARSLSQPARLEEARAILERNAHRGANVPSFIAEWTLVRADAGESAAALEAIDRSPFGQSVDTGVALAVTKARRVLLSTSVDDGRRFSEKKLAELVSEIQVAAESNPALLPLGLVSRLQTASVLLDGQVLAQERTGTFAQIKQWIRDAARLEVEDAHDDEPTFARQWSLSVDAVLGELGDAPTGDHVASHVTRCAGQLDELQETFEHRLATLV